MSALQPMPADWDRALVLMAHPDDPEYGLAAAVHTWTQAGRDVRYVLGTRGEAGIAGLNPAEAGPLREQEQRSSAAAVGVGSVDFLGYPDGRLVHGLELRRDLAREIRRFRPQLVLTLNHHDSWGAGTWNSPDHRAFGRSVLDAAGDAGNEWIFPELAGEGLAVWAGVRWVGVVSPYPTHAVRVDGSIEAAVESLSRHERYLQALSPVPVRQQATEQVGFATRPDESFGPGPIARFELVNC